MFKNLTIYRIGAGWTPELTAMEEALVSALGGEFKPGEPC